MPLSSPCSIVCTVACEAKVGAGFTAGIGVFAAKVFPTLEDLRSAIFFNALPRLRE